MDFTFCYYSTFRSPSLLMFRKLWSRESSLSYFLVRFFLVIMSSLLELKQVVGIISWELVGMQSLILIKSS